MLRAPLGGRRHAAGEATRARGRAGGGALSTGGSASRDNRVLHGPVGWEVLRFGAPIALGMGLQTTFNLVDAYVIARLEPSVAGPALGALGICDQLSAVGTIVSYGVTTASTAMIAQAFGRGDAREVRRVVWQSILAIAALSVVFSFGSALFAGTIMRELVGAKGAVAALGTRYLRVNAGGAFSMFFLLHLTAIQRALGSAKTPVALLVLSNVLNLFLAVLFVYGAGPAPPVFAWGSAIAAALHVPRMELLGAAWATVLARSIVLVPVVVLLVRRFDVFDRESVARPSWPVLRAIARVAWPSSTQFVVRTAAMLLTQALVARAFTTAADQSATTALGIVFRLETMALFVAMGWGSAAQTFVAQNLGAGEHRRATRSGVVSAAYAALMMLLIAAAYLLRAEPVIRFFDADPAVVRVALGYVDVVSLGYVGLGVGIVLGSAITGAGDTRTTLLVDLGVVLAFQIPACVLAVVLPGASLARLFRMVTATYLLSGLAYALVYRFVPWIAKGRARIAGVS